MRAIVYSETGPSSVLRLVDREVPEPGPGEVRVRLRRAGVNPTDWKFRAGMMRGFDEVTPGQDGAGIVDAVGEGVEHLRVGDRVWLLLAQHGRAHGTAADYTVHSADRVVHLPDGASYDQGASLGVPAITAHRALTSGEVHRLGPGSMADQVVLVAGGAGAVGHAAIQLARWAGATVITTVSREEKADLARSAGAHHVINYRDPDVVDQILAIAPGGVDLVVEVAPAPNQALDLAVTRVHGTIAIYANNGGAELTLPLRETFSRNLRYQFIILYTLDPALLSLAITEVSAALTDGALAVGEDAGLPLLVYPLADTAAAHDAVEAGAVGKVLIDLGG